MYFFYGNGLIVAPWKFDVITNRSQQYSMLNFLLHSQMNTITSLDKHKAKRYREHFSGGGISHVIDD